MKKILVFIFAIHILLFFTASPILAESERPSQVTSENRSGNVIALGNRMANRMQAAIDRMKKLSERIQSRINKLKVQGKDVAKFTSWVATMNTNLSSAQTALGKFRADLANYSTTSDPRASIQQLQLDAKLVKDALVAAHTTMKQVVQTLLTT